MVRKSVVVFAAVLSLAVSVSAHAQFGAYGTVTVEQVGGLKSSPVTVPGTTYDNTVAPIGGTGGVFYDFKTFGIVRLGADVRGSIESSKRGAETSSDGGGARLESGLAGVRAVFHTKYSALQPYLEGAAGIGRSNYGILLPTAASKGLTNNFQYNVFGGLDLKLLPMMDFRAFELGYGGLNPFGTDSHNYPLKSISSGVVFHFSAQ